MSDYGNAGKQALHDFIFMKQVLYSSIPSAASVVYTFTLLQIGGNAVKL